MMLIQERHKTARSCAHHDALYGERWWSTTWEKLLEPPAPDNPPDTCNRQQSVIVQTAGVISYNDDFTYCRQS